MNRMVRTSGKALIIRDGCMPGIRLHDADGDFYILPGGGQTAGEPSWGCHFVEELEDEVNERTRVYMISRQEWQAQYQ